MKDSNLGSSIMVFAGCFQQQIGVSLKINIPGRNVISSITANSVNTLSQSFASSFRGGVGDRVSAACVRGAGLIREHKNFSLKEHSFKLVLLTNKCSLIGTFKILMRFEVKNVLHLHVMSSKLKRGKAD